MSRTPTHADAELILKLYDLRREPRMREARRWFMSSFHASTPEEFQALCPPGSEENASYRMITTYWNMAASFVVSGVLHPELFYQSNQEMMFVWERVRELIPRSRELYKNPLILKNIEEVAQGYLQWWEKEAPEFYPTFSNMVRSLGRQQGPQPIATEDDEAH
ncbi:MAG TPA: hypothetical protein VMW27_27710 [Thermoanaerobaculia bacterium]|nr:hypothetical protein [Thermoanaerobaculia bacterium]